MAPATTPSPKGAQGRPPGPTRRGCGRPQRRPARARLPTAPLPRPGRASLPTCWISSSVSGCCWPSSFMGKLVCGSSTVSRYLPLFELCSWLLAPVTDRTKSLPVVPCHPGRQRRRGGTHKFRAAARAAAPGPRGCSPQRMAGQPRPPRDRQILRGRFPPGIRKTGTPENLHEFCRVRTRPAHGRGGKQALPRDRKKAAIPGLGSNRGGAERTLRGGARCGWPTGAQISITEP